MFICLLAIHWMSPASGDASEAQLGTHGRGSGVMSKWMTNIPFTSVPSISLKLCVLQLLYRGSLCLLWEARISLYANLIFLRMHKTSFPGGSKRARDQHGVFWKPRLRGHVTKSSLPHPHDPHDHSPNEIEGLAVTRSIARLDGGRDISLPVSSHSPETSPLLWSPSLSLGN